MKNIEDRARDALDAVRKERGLEAFGSSFPLSRRGTAYTVETICRLIEQDDTKTKRILDVIDHIDQMLAAGGYSNKGKIRTQLMEYKLTFEPVDVVEEATIRFCNENEIAMENAVWVRKAILLGQSIKKEG